MGTSSSPAVVSVSSLREFFHDSMQQALAKCDVAIDEHTEHYVVNVLTGFSRSEAFLEQGTAGRAQVPLALILAEAREAPTAHHQDLLLQRLGDVALFTAGFFAASFERRLVDIDYHIAMGAQAYGTLAGRAGDTARARALSTVFDELADKFQRMVDVLNEIAEASKRHTHLDVLRLYEIYLKTGSPRALGILHSLGVDPVAHGARGPQ